MPFRRKIQLAFFVGYILTLIGVTAEDLMHGLSLTSALSDYHHHIAPIAVGSFTSLFLWQIRKTEKVLSEKSSKYFLVGGFFAGYTLTLIGITAEDITHGITLINSLSDFHHHIFPLIVGSFTGVIICAVSRKDKALTKVETKFKLVIEQSPSVYELYDLNGFQVEVNQAYEDLWQFPEGRKRTVGKFNILRSNEVDRTGLSDYVKRAYAGEVVMVPPYKFNPAGETEANGVGRVRWLSTKIYPLKDQNKVTNIVINHEDVTGRIEAEEEKNRLEAETIRFSQLATLGELSAGVAHEINNPISGVINYSQLLLNKKDFPPTERDLIVRIQREGERVANIVNSLLNYSRDSRSSRKQTDIKLIVYEALSVLDLSYKKEGVSILFEWCENLPQVDCCFQQIEQVLINILRNAYQALSSNPRDDRQIIVSGRVVTDSDGDYLQLKVSNNGPHIPQDILDKILLPFTTTKPEGEGTGLGLSISAKIMEEHGGRLEVRSKPNELTEMVLFLPI